MLATLLTAASEPSKVPWFIAGSVLAVWAVVLAWMGITQPEFPNGLGGQRAVIGITGLIVAIAIAMAIVTA